MQEGGQKALVILHIRRTVLPEYGSQEKLHGSTRHPAY